MRRLPILPTLVVALAFAGMIALGIWQLRRARWKDAFMARYAGAERQPAVAFPTGFPVPETALYRRSSIVCLEPVSWTAEAGEGRSGKPGWRHIAACRTGAEGPGVYVDAGVSSSPDAPRGWRGGHLRGVVAWAPAHTSVIARALGRAPPPSPMLVSDTAAPGLEPSARPSPSDLPNNHLSYAVQWFAFAAIAAIIYALALRRRRVTKAP